MSGFLSMSDEQVMAMGGIAPEPAPQEVQKSEPVVDEQHVEQPAAAEADAGAGEQVAAQSEAVEAQADEDDAEDDAAAARAAEEAAGAHAHQPGKDAGPGEQAQPPKGEGKPADQTASALNLPEGAERIFESFRANGRDMKVKSVDEAIRLMQMGANYSQKQAGHKKDRAYLRVLEQNDLLDQEKLAFAVDLIKGKPEAIGKLIKDTNFDVHEIDEAKVASYRAESKAPSDNVLAIEDVINDIRDHKQFGRLNTEMQQWDERSQALLGQHPDAMAQLVEQMESGVYDTIMDEVNHRQVLGQLRGIPVMQAYNQIGQEMTAAGAFNAPAPKEPVKLLVTPGKKTSPADKATEERRRAAAPSKGASTVETAPKKPDFLNMSDEDFAKFTKR